MKSIRERSKTDIGETRFLCPKCGGGCRIVDSRMSLTNGRARRRRYMCIDCGERFTTVERMAKE